MTNYKAIIAGGGPAGLAAAALLAKEGTATALVAPASTEDPRTVALMQPSIQLLRYLGVWPGVLEGSAASLRKLRLIDDTGALFTAPNLEFDSQELNLEAFGWNIPLGQLLPALRKRAEDLGVIFIEATTADAEVSDRRNTYQPVKWRQSFRICLHRCRWRKFSHAKICRHCHR